MYICVLCFALSFAIGLPPMRGEGKLTESLDDSVGQLNAAKAGGIGREGTYHDGRHSTIQGTGSVLGHEVPKYTAHTMLVGSGGS